MATKVEIEGTTPFGKDGKERQQKRLAGQGVAHSFGSRHPLVRLRGRSSICAGRATAHGIALHRRDAWSLFLPTSVSHPSTHRKHSQSWAGRGVFRRCRERSYNRCPALP